VTLDAARQRGDAIADAVIQRLGREVWAMNTLMEGCRGNSQPLPERLPAAAREFFEQHSALPPWLQPTRIMAAQRWATEQLLPITAALFHAALPSAYAAERGATVLLATGRMANDLDRRVNETARFVMDVLAPESFEPRGVGIRSVQQVRLVHAAVRVWLRERPPWPGEVPLNQEDMLGTLLTFSVVVVRAMRRLGVPVTSAEAEDFYHLWRVVGALLGIEQELLPQDFAAAEALAERIAQRHFRGSAAGKQLMQALLARIGEHVAVPGMTHYLVRRLAGDRVAELLGVPSDDGFRTTLAKLTRLPFIEQASLKSVLPQLTTLVGKPLFDGIIRRKLGGELAGFAAPTSSVLRNQQG
jgi:uncharacterized protein (DUF2236 family)